MTLSSHQAAGSRYPAHEPPRRRARCPGPWEEPAWQPRRPPWWKQPARATSRPGQAGRAVCPDGLVGGTRARAVGGGCRRRVPDHLATAGRAHRPVTTTRVRWRLADYRGQTRVLPGAPQAGPRGPPRRSRSRTIGRGRRPEAGPPGNRTPGCGTRSRSSPTAAAGCFGSGQRPSTPATRRSRRHLAYRLAASGQLAPGVSSNCGGCWAAALRRTRRRTRGGNQSWLTWHSCQRPSCSR
jgi:hypothetical protein